MESEQRNDWREIWRKILHRPKATIPGSRNDRSLRLTKSMGSISYLVVNLTEGSPRIYLRVKGVEKEEGFKGEGWGRVVVWGGVGGTGLSGVGGGECSGLARTPGGLDGVARHRPEYYGLIKPS